MSGSGGTSTRNGGTGSNPSPFLVIGGVAVLVLAWPRIQAQVMDRLARAVSPELVNTITRAIPFVAVLLAVAVVLAVVHIVVGSGRKRKKKQLVEALTDPLPRSWQAEPKLRLSWTPFTWRLRAVAVEYPADTADRDPEVQQTIAGTIVYRAGFEASRTIWQPQKLRVTVKRRRPEPVRELTPIERARQEATARIQGLLAPLFGVPITVQVDAWEEPETTFRRPALEVAGCPTRIVVEYADSMSRDTSEVWRRRLEKVVALKVPPGNARWSGDYQTAGDRIVLTHRPELPAQLRHPGAGAWARAKAIELPYGEDDRGFVAAWDLTGPRSSSTVHTLVIGPTGGGKTTLIRSVVVGATGQGVPTYGIDPKRIELTPFRGWPGVGAVASSAEDMAELIRAIHGLMEYRYDLIETEGKQALDDMRPVVLILDEQLILNATLNRWWAANKARPSNVARWGTDKGTTHPALALVTELTVLARSANIRLVFGVQRPDAELYERGARDSLRHRVSLGRLSQEGARMIWGDPYTGTDTPMVPGRAMASPDGGDPREVQTYWVPDPQAPRSREDRELMAELHAAALAQFPGVPDPEGLTLTGLSDGAFARAEGPVADDPAALPAPAGDTREHSETVSTQTVAADQLAVGDQVVNDAGQVETVKTVSEIENPDDPDSADFVAIDLADAAGAVRTEEGPADTAYARVINLDE